jgi:hypothetical protein
MRTNNRWSGVALLGGVLAAIAVSTASADVAVQAQFHVDRWAGEAGWTLVNAESVVVASMAPLSGLVATGSAVVSQTSELWGPGPFEDDGFRHIVNMQLAVGAYTITLTDTFGDGWVAGNVTGLDALEFLPVDGVLNVVPAGPFAFTNGSSVTYSFTVVPAPGAIALLGVAGLVGSRRRRA